MFNSSCRPSHSLKRGSLGGVCLLLAGLLWACGSSMSTAAGSGTAHVINTAAQPAEVPIILTQPESTTVDLGDTATFHVQATGSPKPDYQWQRLAQGVWTNLDHGEEADLVVPRTSVKDDGALFRVAVSNRYGVVLSSTVTLKVLYFHITQQPQDQSVTAGQTATFNVIAAPGSEAPISYQWMKRASGTDPFSPIPGAVNPSYTTPPTTVMDSGASFAVRVREESDDREARHRKRDYEEAVTLLSQPAHLLVNVGISPTRGSVSTGSTLTFTSATAGASGMAWSVVEPGGGSITPTWDGLSATYQAPMAPGTYHVRLVTQSPDLAAQAEVVVYAAGSSQDVARVRVSPVRLTALPQQRLRVNALVQGGTNPKVVWTIQEGPAGGSITQDGLYTSPGAPGLYHLVASLQADASIRDTLEVTVVPSVSSPAIGHALGLAGATISAPLQTAPARLTLDPGSSAYLTAYGATSGSVSWGLVEGSSAGLLTPAPLQSDPNFVLYTAPQALGVYHALATDATDPSQNAGVVIEVGMRVDVQISPGQATLDPGGKANLVGTVLNTQDTRLSWALLEPSGGALTVNADGSATFTAINPGLYHVVATSLADPLRSAVVILTVNGRAAVSVAVSPASQRVLGGTQLRFSATVSGTPDQGVTWGASSGTIDGSGLFTTPASATGPITITAASTVDPSAFGTASVTVAYLPVFSSLPPPSASLGMAYSYTPLVTHPGGLGVSLSLLQAPAGATLAGGTLTWTPQSSQIGQPHFFQLQATDTAGGTAIQTWTPDLRVVGLDLGTTYYGKQGVVVVPGTATDYSSQTIQALVDNGTGYTTYPGAGSSDGRFWIPGVPPGPYLLRIGSQYSARMESQVILSAHSIGRPDVKSLDGTPNTTGTFNISGMDPWTLNTDFLEFFSMSARHYLTVSNYDFASTPPTAGATVVTGTIDYDQLLHAWPNLTEVDPAKGDDLILAQFTTAQASSPLPYAVLSRALNLPSSPILNGQSAYFAGQLTPLTGTVRSMNATYRHTQFEAVTSQVHPQAVISWYSLFADAVPFGQELGFQAEGTPDLMGATWGAGAVPAGDWTFNAIQVLDPWEPTWIRRIAGIIAYRVPYQLPGASRLWLSSLTWSTQPWQDGGTAELGLTLSPALNVLIDGANAQVDQTLTSLMPVLSWDAPAVGTAAAYWVTVRRLGILNGATVVLSSSTFTGLTKRTLRLPPGVLVPGATYAIQVTARSTPSASLYQALSSVYSGVLTTP